MKTQNATAEWVKHDTYEVKKKMPRINAILCFIRGEFRLQWDIPTTKKRKGLYLTGRKVK